MDNIQLGKIGEGRAKDYLIKKGYQIEDVNYRKRSGEVDIIALDPNHNEYVFVEVKTRKSQNFGFPEDSIDRAKVNKITETAECWIHEKRLDDSNWRIDIISIEWNSGEPIINHYENI